MYYKIYRNISTSSVGVKRRSNIRVVLARGQRWLPIDVRVVQNLRVAPPEGQTVGGGAVGVAEEDRVFSDLQAVEAVPKPLIVHHVGQLSVPVAACNVRMSCQLPAPQRR